ncbi:MAG: HAD-IA family hydrolase [Thaumarchaeota archaeon]|nr:HAD-IA family hydrolase [Nitrososphaerota archaeon]
MTNIRFRFLTFDCYGTLIDWKAGIQENLGRAIYGDAKPDVDLLPLYLELEPAEEKEYKLYRDVLRNVAIATARRVGRPISEKAADEFSLSVPRWPAFSDTRSALEKMGELGLRRFILSNVDTNLLEQTIKDNFLEVDGFVTAQQIRSYKPAPKHWKEFLSRTGATREEVLHVAQSVYHDIIPATGLGFSTAWVNRYSERLPSEAEPTFISNTLGNLIPLLC